MYTVCVQRSAGGGGRGESEVVGDGVEEDKLGSCI